MEIDIQEGNKLIAIFMKEETSKGVWGKNWEAILDSFGASSIPPYHSSWDWLMPVIREISTYSLVYEEEAKRFWKMSVLINRDVLYQEVIKFIKFHNQQSKQS